MEAQFGQRIRTIRKSLKLTQEEFSKKCGVSLTSLRRYEANERQPNMSVLVGMAEALEMTLADFMWGVTERDRASKNLLLEAFDQLNDAGQQKAVERVEELTEIPKYQKEHIE